MVTTAARPHFLDTNVLIYSRNAASPFHPAAVDAIRRLETNGHASWISRQVLREYLAGLSRPGAIVPPVPMADLLTDVSHFSTRYQIAEDGPLVTTRLALILSAVPCAGKQIHDANFVATVQAHGIPALVTHNVADFTRFTPWITVVPLIPPPTSAPHPPGVP